MIDQDRLIVFIRECRLHNKRVVVDYDPNKQIDTFYIHDNRFGHSPRFSGKHALESAYRWMNMLYPYDHEDDEAMRIHNADALADAWKALKP